ncbi:GumC domain-containing protein [Paludisphaera rhizosphaerae]|uniref:hypothetical protein n=1 Tax=Paludisphaera rhizosphaerae TaxID=2711216 RepID=UPI0013EA609D|nr:hypothetical protein [Paludisphaera rhizosphaerae]
MSSAPPSRQGARLWPTLLAAAALAAAVDLAIFLLVPPQFEARSIVEVRTRRPILFADANEPLAYPEALVQRIIETAINSITVDSVLNEAVADPSVVNLPSIKASAWPVALIRDRLKVYQIPRTELVVVSFKSHDPVEAAAVVNAVTRTYLDMTRNRSSAGDEQYMKSLKSYLDSVQKEIQRLKAESSESDAEMDAVFNRLLAERLFPIMLEQAETDDVAKKAELEEKIKRLRGLARKGADAWKLLDWKSRYESLRRDYEHISRKLQNLEFANRDAIRVELRQEAAIPKAPTDDPRWLSMALATTVILLLGLAIGLRLDLARPAAARESVEEV